MLTVLLLLAVGVAVARLRAVPAGTADVLDRVVVLLAFPGLVLAEVVELEVDASVLVPVGVVWGQFAVLVGLVLLASRALRLGRATTGTLLLCVPLGNTAFLGFPVVEALLGPGAVRYAIVYDQLGTFLALATWGTFVAARWGAGPDPSLRVVARRVVGFPPFVALVVALVGRTTGLPAPLLAVAGALGAMLVPLTMLSLGMRLQLPERSALPPLAVGLGLRMVVAPALVLGVATALGAGGPAWATSVLQSAMPPMVTAGIVATAAGLDGRLAAALTGGGVLVALVTLPLVGLVAG